MARATKERPDLARDVTLTEAEQYPNGYFRVPCKRPEGHEWQTVRTYYNGQENRGAAYRGTGHFTCPHCLAEAKVGQKPRRPYAVTLPRTPWKEPPRFSRSGKPDVDAIARLFEGTPATFRPEVRADA